jgi:protein-S-isoprenylcysteine O-methyltransferase Ste14
MRAMHGRWLLALAGLYVALALVGRTLLQRRRFGTTGFRALRPDQSPVETLANLGFVMAWGGLFAAGEADLNDALEPIASLDRPGVEAAGCVLYAAGLVGTLVAQSAMGDAWRVGVDPAERTRLVTHGPFALVRNPIYTAMLSATVGLALIVPNPLALAVPVVLWLSLEVQTRRVEEPYLLRTHGEAYAQYAARVGRFLPKVGRLGSD